MNTETALFTPENDRENLDLNEKKFQQLLTFSNAVCEVQKFIEEHPDTNIDAAVEILDRYLFPERQKKYFIDGLNILFSRREKVKKTINIYKEKFGEEKYVAEIFKNLFGSSGTFGEIHLYPDPNNLIFVCKNHLDFVQGIKPGTDVYNTIIKSDVPLDEAPSSEQMGLPIGAFCADTKITLDGVGSLGGAIIFINNSGLTNREGVELENVVRHEQQHAENSLYLRPWREILENTANKILESKDSLEKFWLELDSLTAEGYAAIDKITKTGEVLTFSRENQILDEHLNQNQRDRMKELFHENLNRTAQQLKELVDYFRKGSMEWLVKEELLAFYFSGMEMNGEIKNIIPEYITDLRKKLISIRSFFEKILIKYYPENMLNELGFQNSSDKLRFGDFSVAIESFTGHHNPDPKNIIDTTFSQAATDAFEKFINKCEKEIAEGLKIFEKIDKADDEIRRILKPILISQPMLKWGELVKRALAEVKK